MNPKSCPNCGAELTAGGNYCLACGARAGEPAAPLSTGAIVGAILLLLFALGLGAVGGCFVLLGVQPIYGGGDDWIPLAIGAGFLLVALVFTAIAVLLLRRKKSREVTP